MPPTQPLSHPCLHAPHDYASVAATTCGPAKFLGPNIIACSVAAKCEVQQAPRQPPPENHENSTTHDSAIVCGRHQALAARGARCSSPHSHGFCNNGLHGRGRHARQHGRRTARTPMTASSGTPRPKSDILSSVLERARTAGAWRRAGAPMNWLWRAEQREGWRRAIDAAEGAETWNAEAEAAMDTARMIAVLHMISEQWGGVSAPRSPLSLARHIFHIVLRGDKRGETGGSGKARGRKQCARLAAKRPVVQACAGADLVPRCTHRWLTRTRYSAARTNLSDRCVF